MSTQHDGNRPLRGAKAACIVSLPLFLMALLLSACAYDAEPLASVHLHIDGTDRWADSEAATVRAFLQGYGVELGDMDPVEPPVWTPLQSGLHITVTRIEEMREERLITHTVEMIRDEFLSPEDSTVVEAGQDGLEELTFRIHFDGATILARDLVGQRIVVEPRGEVRLVGTKGAIAAIPISGTVAYIANGDAWVMRRSSDEKRPLTRGGVLDGRVFDLSSDGRTLLYSAVVTGAPELLNQVWAVDTRVLNARPRRVGITDVRWAAWAPDGRSFAYASAERREGAPGWRALNDLNLASWPDSAVTQVLSPTTRLVYAWWGESWAWNPDGRGLAYAHGDTVGVLALEAPGRRPLHTFRPYHTQGDWVSLPALAWNRDGSRLVAVVNQGGEESPRFSLVQFEAGTPQMKLLAPEVGPWSGPVWSPVEDALAFGLPIEATNGEPAYRLSMLWGSEQDPQPLLSPEAAIVIHVEACWAPTGRALVAVRDGDLYLFDRDQGTAQPLTASGLVSHPRWR